MIMYLYIKHHSITGLKYFGKTTQKDPFKYLGSGSYWKSHIKKHGKIHIKTLEVWGFDDQKLCTEFALKFSKENNIVESNEWANLIDENGLDGAPTGPTNPGASNSNKLRMKINNPMTKLRQNKTTFKLGHIPVITKERNKKISIAMSGSNNPFYNNPTASKHLNDKTYTCMHCNKTTTKGNIVRWHNNNCKHYPNSISNH